MPLALTLIALTAIVALRYLLVSGGFALLTRRVHPGLYAGQRRQIRREILWSLLSAAIYGLPAGLVIWLWQERGGTAIYDDIGAYPLWWWPVSVAIFLIAHDAWFYWTHRAMHEPRLFRLMHKVHHDSRPPTAWAAMSFHPLEALSAAWLIPALALLVPIHWSALASVLAIASLFGVTNHMGWELFPRRWLDGRFGRVMITASHHHLHHRVYRCNYGLYFRFWDRLCGTDAGLSDELGDEARARAAAGAARAAAGRAGAGA